ncbi:hypothetical protein ILYODFUR_033313 [Ilyodon furcidens]|uniref:Uncharacterized protein n=1 Tax=Ilyodon furcidens TaxID=33524 RepID=A0ABV0U1P4_9TELE
MRKHKLVGSAAARPETASGQSTSNTGNSTPPSSTPSQADVLSWKSDILASIKTDISAVIKSEMKDALAEVFSSFKSELQAVKVEVANGTLLLRADLSRLN